MARGDPEAETFGHEAERLAGGEPPDADGDALAHRNRGPEHRVLFGNGGTQLFADQVERFAAHAEGFSELGFREVRVVALVPPGSRPVFDPESPVVLRRRL